MTEMSNSSAIHPISVTFDGTPSHGPLKFTTTFRVGRSSACEVCIVNDFVSRVHAEVAPTPEGWRIYDLDSANGLYLDGVRVEAALLLSRLAIRLGVEGPILIFELPTPAAGEETIVARYVDRYFREPNAGEPLGEHTQFVRRAFAKVQTSQKRVQARRNIASYTAIALLLLAIVGISRYAWELNKRNQKNRETAREMFYAMKTLDVEIAAAEQAAFSVDKQHGIEQVNHFEARRRDLQEKYDNFLLQSLHFDRSAGTEQHRLILRVARIFGECEIDMPPDFEKEVMSYIKKWQSSGRFARDIRLARDKGYTRKISQALLERGLPAQFFYLAMQESDFNPYATGPMTRKGYAKGMWQFIPETGVRYGLHLGPLVDLDRPDPADDREQVDKATDAAARYLDLLYSTDAQASGLLVMACYNWGEDSVLPLVRSLPQNPRDRNFWRLLAEHRSQIPQQTYDYVFMITSAAVIGENPRLFGFDFDNPLTEATQESTPAMTIR